MDESPSQVRQRIRAGLYDGQTSGMCHGYAQANLVVLSKEYALDFLIFCQRNPKPCPLLDITEPGDPEPKLIAKGADIRTDIPKYRFYKKGRLVGEKDSIKEEWNENMIGFLLGCSFTFENALMTAGIPVRHIEENHNVPMYITNIKCKSAGIFHGPMVVSMRPIPKDMIIRAVQVTSRFPQVHGAPVCIGDPEAIGINDVARPDFGDPSTIYDGEVPVFWACGVTPQAVAMEAQPEIMLTHAPGNMFISDKKDEDYSVF